MKHLLAILAKACFELHKSYPITLIGMPTWDNFCIIIQSKKDLAIFPSIIQHRILTEKLMSFSKSLSAAY